MLRREYELEEEIEQAISWYQKNLDKVRAVLALKPPWLRLRDDATAHLDRTINAYYEGRMSPPVAQACLLEPIKVLRRAVEAQAESPNRLT